MNREEVAMIGFEIVAYAGDARTKILTAIKKAEKKEFDDCYALLEEATELITKAHGSQTKMLQAEAQGEELEMSFIMIHGQDHLMTVMLLNDIAKHLINIYAKEN